MIWSDHIDTSLRNSVRELLLAAAAADGRPDISEDGPLPREFETGKHLFGFVDDVLVGYGTLDEHGDAFGRQVAELIVHPARRGNGYGSALFDAVLAQASTTVRAWSHGDHPAAAVIAERAGLVRVRELLKMTARAAELVLSDGAAPEGIQLRAFRPGVDEQAVVEVNARAFSWHPEQGALTVGDLVAAEQEPWFDPDGFFLAERIGESGDPTLLGFHWTKVHQGASPAGEVYVVGVDPSAQGTGVGTLLTSVGLRYLLERGLRTVVLYVEGDNAPAIAVYRRLGFQTSAVDAQYGS